MPEKTSEKDWDGFDLHIIRQIRKLRHLKIWIG
jgi:hypothetical protein